MLVKQKIKKLPFRKSKLGVQSLSYRGPNTWNKLPINLQATNVNCFKDTMKAYFRYRHTLL